jgi:pimeloyl-ACP methyl ester carboxylesterase
MAEDIYQFIIAMGLERPALYGHSDGGIIALLLELSHPGTLGIMAVSGTNLKPEGIIPSFIEEYTEINRKKPDPLITLMLTEPHIAPESLKTITIPVLVTAGDDDLILPDETWLLAESLPGSTLVFVKDADHGSYIVDSDIMGEMLIKFFAKEWK